MFSIATALLVTLVSTLPSVQAPPDSKAQLSAAQRKIASTLRQEIERRRGAPTPQPLPDVFKVDDKGRVLIDIRADATSVLRTRVIELGGAVESAAPEYHSMLAWMPLMTIEDLASERAVQTIVPAAAASIHK